MMTEEEFEELRREHQAAERKASEARGALAGLRERLRQEFGLKTVPEAREKLKQLVSEKARLEKAFRAGLEKYRKEFDQDDH